MDAGHLVWFSWIWLWYYRSRNCKHDYECQTVHCLSFIKYENENDNVTNQMPKIPFNQSIDNFRKMHTSDEKLPPVPPLVKSALLWSMFCNAVIIF